MEKPLLEVVIGNVSSDYYKNLSQIERLTCKHLFIHLINKVLANCNFVDLLNAYMVICICVIRVAGVLMSRTMSNKDES